MKNVDIVIVGAGMVGLALAGLLAETDCQIILIEEHKPNLSQKENKISHRVSAINLASQEMLQKIGAWQKIPCERLSPYMQMNVWEKDSFAHIHFDNHDPLIQQLGLEHLGVIVENEQIQLALWQVIQQQKNVEILYDKPTSLGVSDNGAFLTLASGEMLSAKLVVGADGANSWVREQSQIPLMSQDYQHTALVCNVKTTEQHQRTARQVFSPENILAFLPLNNEYLCSIVWSLPPEQAKLFNEMDEISFNRALTIAFDNQLGLCEVQSSRAIYPLVARYARDFAQPRIVIVGDAAHTIHPLAGLGVNLGFADVIMLANELKQHLLLGNDIGEYRHLRRFERRRKAEAVKVLVAMKGLKSLFESNNPVKKLLRGTGLRLANESTLIKKFFIEQTIQF
ncbi:FAD-dependent 2-octaprenylphenol hydroxylase [Vespertiliibacter pulmonis]|uniref:2-octaprenylphenol hydroxylase n=1 Tax=Vespertiliibacter pulmonis TaxID=1443036 RepID=A0A3N4VYL5_9PAST|nr:FAD-dependent monooxygenase [Vespertiliibacter pulmonis]QLB20284.1 FAD-dependent 2-octaprenylphenol hydroxylase [Vespertiliibacter pulmonis]RPE86265.1 2-octaprenylphenol hydroxylase [Vespertiliibacter pulmonis]